MARKKTPKFPQSGQPIERSAEATRAARHREELEIWKTRIARAQKIRKDWELEFRVEECERYFLGDQFETPRRRSKDMVFNLTRATIRTMKPNFFHTAPKFYVRPKPGLSAPAQETNAAIGESLLESIGEQDRNLKNAANLAITQAFFRVGVIKACYDPRLEPNPQAGQPIYEEGEDGTMMDDLGRPIPKRDPVTSEVLTEPTEVLCDDIYRYEYVDARRLLLPDEGPDASKWTWIGEEVTVLLDDAKDDTRFAASVRGQLQANGPHVDEGRSRARMDPKPEVDKALTYIEVYDMRAKRLRIWAEGQEREDWLMETPLPSGIEDHPYALLILGDPITGPVPLPWPVPFTHSWLDPAREYNINRKQIQNAAKRAARKGVYFSNSFENVDEAVKILQSPDDMTFALCNDPKAAPVILDQPNIPQDVYRAAQMTLMDFRMITGVTGARAGVPEGKTATEQGFIERAADLRDADSVSLVNDWLSDAGTKMFQLVKATLQLDVWVQLRSLSDTEMTKYLERRLGMQPGMLKQMAQAFPGFKEVMQERVGGDQWRRVTREQLTFEADVTVVPGSARPRNLDLERRVWLEFLQLLGQFPHLALSPALLKITAQKFDGLIDDRALDEIAALAEKMVNINANQAGRTQGGTPNTGAGTGSTAGNPDLGALLAGIAGAA